MKYYFLCVLALFPTINANGRQNKSVSPNTIQNEKGITDTSAIISYETLQSKSDYTFRGMFKIYEYKERYYFEIPDSILKKQFLVVNRISKGPSGLKLYGGDEIANVVVRFENGPDNKVLLRKQLFNVYPGAGDTSAHYQAVMRSDDMPILASFNKMAVAGNKRLSVIDLTDFIQGDNELFSLSAMEKGNNSLKSLLTDNSFIDSIQDFPMNVEIAAIKTYNQSISIGPGVLPAGNTQTISGNITMELNTSIIQLPEHPMQERFRDDRVGYFSIRQLDYDANPEGVGIRDFIKRWRIEPRLSDLKKYNDGILVEPEKPIVFYIDPATPPKWIPYLIQGVDDWQKAFEQAGFRNAIVGERAPSKKEDSTWSLFDARHSAIVYKASDIENASGPSIADPRTGEILESHINWYHNVIQLLHDWYMLQCGTVDPRAQKRTFDDSLMGQLIRFVCSHEVGHALGLTHNFGASSMVATDSLRSKEWVEANGFCPSIMDYARFNYVAQPEDSIGEIGLLPRIGIYDKWAIEFGYRRISSFKSPEAERPFLNKWVIEKMADKRLWFGPEQNWGDPRIQSEDLGDNVLKANEYGIRNLKRIIPQLANWTAEPGEGYERLTAIYKQAISRFEEYLVAARENIGGMYETLKSSDQKGTIYEPVNKQKSVEAFLFLKNEFLSTAPAWLVDTTILSKTGLSGLTIYSELMRGVFNSMLSPPYLGITLRNEAIYGKKIYTLRDYFSDLKQTIWTELYTHRPIDLYRRTMQSIYIKELFSSFNRTKGIYVQMRFPYTGPNEFNITDVASILYSHLKDIQTDIKKAVTLINDKITTDHLNYIYFKIDKYLNDPNNKYDH